MELPARAVTYARGPAPVSRIGDLARVFAGKKDGIKMKVMAPPEPVAGRRMGVPVQITSVGQVIDFLYSGGEIRQMPRDVERSHVAYALQRGSKTLEVVGPSSAVLQLSRRLREYDSTDEAGGEIHFPLPSPKKLVADADVLIRAHYLLANYEGESDVTRIETGNSLSKRDALADASEIHALTLRSVVDGKDVTWRADFRFRRISFYNPVRNPLTWKTIFSFADTRLRGDSVGG